ncbi:PQQ-binding-like beta-propeller repeat protein [Isosphaeraceae bacterium EP7]
MNRRNLISFALLTACVAGLAAEARAQTPTGRKVLGADRGRLAIVNQDGAVEWEMPFPASVHSLQLLPNGHILTHNVTKVFEIDPKTKEVVWAYESHPREGYTGKIEIHTVRRLADGLTMIAETGNKRIIEVDRTGTIVHSTNLKVEKPDTHRDTRMVTKLKSSNYLVCQELDGAVNEYTPDGEIVWTYKLDLAGRPASPGHDGHGTEVFGAIRLKSGNTLIAAGNGNRVIEVNPSGKVVWSIEQNELPGIKLGWVTSLVELPNGNILFGNTHAGPENPQLIEVTRDKAVVWTLKDHNNFGNDMAAAVVIDPPSGK